jgi:peptidoglycan/LPS O-acetylase OafA/YrhL
LVAILACAELSYWAVEQPFLRLRDRARRRQGGDTPVHA